MITWLFSLKRYRVLPQPVFAHPFIFRGIEAANIYSGLIANSSLKI